MGATIVIRRQVSAAPSFVADRSVSAFEARNERNHTQPLPLKDRARELLCQDSAYAIGLKMANIDMAEFHKTFGPRANLVMGKGDNGLTAIYVVNRT